MTICIITQMLFYYDFNKMSLSTEASDLLVDLFSERNVFKSFSIFLMLFIISMFRLFSWLFQSSSTLAFNLPVWRSRQLLVRTAAAQIMRKLNWLLHRLVMENETTNNKNNKIIGKLMLARYLWELKIIDNFTETKIILIASSLTNVTLPPLCEKLSHSDAS